MSTNNNNKDFVAISINDSSVSYPLSSKLYCNLCSCNLVLLDAQKEEWFCNRCHVSYFPNKGEKVKRANKFETPHKENKVLVSMVDDSTRGPSSVYNPPKLPPSFENLIKRTGVKLLDYTTSED